MSQFSKHDDIEAVMKKAEKTLQNIQNEYQKSLNCQVTSELLVDVKDYLGNLKSALDYLANKIGTSDGYFPVANSRNDFVHKTKDLSEKIIIVLEKWQPYNNNEWIQWFNSLNNKSKHLTLIPQTRRESREFSIKKNGAGITARGCSFHGNISFGVAGINVPIDEQTQFPVSMPGVDIQKIIWVNFIFDNKQFSFLPPNLSVLPFLKTCLNNIKNIIFEVEGLMD